MTDAPRTNITLSLHQLLFISHSETLNGHIGANILLPFAGMVNAGKELQSINPNRVGDAAIGILIQWYDKKIWGLNVSYQVGENLIVPSGNFNRLYDVNTSAHRYRYLSHFEFTLVPYKQFAISVKNNFYFYSREIGVPNRLGSAYNLNYALEYKLTKAITAEIAGYYLTQLEQDSYNGDKDYYHNLYGIEDTRERVFGAGAGFGFTTATNVSLELKAMWETAAKNRTEGFRDTLVLSLPLDFH